jgi:hypothetical protein
MVFLLMFLRDFFLAWRKLVRRPGAALLAVVSLGLAIGFSTAAFSVVDAYYYRALPVKDPGRLADAMVRDREGRLDGINWAEFQAIQQQARTLDGIMVQNRQGPVVKLPDRDDFPITAGVSDNFFDVLGVQAAMGRVFHGNAGADGQVVLTDRYLENRVRRRRCNLRPHRVGTRGGADGHRSPAAGLLGNDARDCR